MNARTFSSTIELRPGVFSADSLAGMGRHWGWILATGIIYILLGIGALAMPVAGTWGLAIALAAILIVSGVVNFVQAVRLRKEVGAGTRFLQAILSIVVGGLIVRWPEGGMLGIALMLSFYFLISAAAQWLLFSAIKPIGAYRWGLVSSVMTFLLAVFIIASFPFSALWVPGTLLGIDLLFAGAGMVGLAFAVRKLHRGTADEKKMQQSVA